MIERGSGRTSGLTDWHRMDVNSMWACLQDHDTTNHWKQVAGWRKICDLAQTHLSRLREYRRGLAEAWPPATNAAARAYLAELDELIDKVRRTHDAAAANYTALAAATQAISGTRARLKTIHEEYAAKLQQKQAYEATAADPKAAMGSRVPDRPVTDADLEQLNVQARGIMYGLSSELQQAQVTLQRPPAMRPPRDPADPDVYGSSLSAPAVPTIVPVPISTTGGAPPRKLSPAASIPAPASKSPVNGPTLGGLSATSGTKPHSAVSGASSHAPTHPSTGVSPSPPPLSPGIPRTPATRGPGRNPSDVDIREHPSGRTEARSLSSPSRAVPSTGLIGGVPNTGQPVTGSGNAPARHANPVGGVIGGGSAGTAPTGGAGSHPGGRRTSPGSAGFLPVGGAAGANGSAPGSARLASHNHSRDQWDPNSPWEVQKGVPPIVQPPDDQGPMDPGPAIGLDR